MARITGTEERNGVMYYTTDTGAIVPVKAVLQSQHPNVDFDDMGQAVGGVPSADNEIDPKPENVFGDVVAKYGNEEIELGRGILANAGNVAAQSLSPRLGILRNIASYPADIVNGLAMMGSGALQKGVAGVSEIVMPKAYEDRMARDVNAMIEMPMFAGSISTIPLGLDDAAKAQAKMWKKGLLQ